MPTPVQLELALAGVALARSWLVGDRETVELIEAEVVSQALVGLPAVVVWGLARA